MEVQFTAVTRSLEMLLDQLYYWARRAAERRSEGADREIPERMLALATENVERFVTTLLDCYRPIELEPMAMSTSELVAALARRARDGAASASVVVSGAAEGTVLADGDQLSRVWSAVLRRLGARTAPGALHVTVAAAARGDRRGVEIVLRQSGAPRTLGTADAMVDLEWALARRIVGLHGGELGEEDLPRGHAMVVFLPAR